MSKKAIFTAMSALVMCTSTACVSKNVAAACTVEGAMYLSGDASPAQICRDFEKRVDQALAAEDVSVNAKKISVAIELQKRGSAKAQVTGHGVDGPIEYPMVAVDVMDRSLSQNDLDKLADAVAKMLMTQ